MKAIHVDTRGRSGKQGACTTIETTGFRFGLIPGSGIAPQGDEQIAIMNNNTSPKSAFTLIEIMLVVALIGLLVAIAIPTFIRARSTSQATACINNLRQLDSAMQQWALEQHKKPSDSYQLTDLTPYLKGTDTNGLLACPGGGTYSVGPANCVTSPPACSLGSSVPPHAQ
jgi:prepilin-type N-terminal cleavage/methylation domain-containing protein